jgi:hypothetical protein
MTESERDGIADEANEEASLSRRAGAPRLDADSSRETLLRWLKWNDPNGGHLDHEAKADGFDPYTLDEAWEAIDAMLEW